MFNAVRGDSELCLVAAHADFRQAVLDRCGHSLCGVSPHQLEIYRSRRSYMKRRSALSADTLVYNIGNFRYRPLVVTIVDAARGPMLPSSIRKCQRLLRNMETTLRNWYEVPGCMCPSLLDFIRCKDGVEMKDWAFKTAPRTEERESPFYQTPYKVREGYPLTRVALRDICTTAEWAVLYYSCTMTHTKPGLAWTLRRIVFKIDRNFFMYNTCTYS